MFPQRLTNREREREREICFNFDLLRPIFTAWMNNELGWASALDKDFMFKSALTLTSDLETWLKVTLYPQAFHGRNVSQRIKRIEIMQPSKILHRNVI